MGHPAEVSQVPSQPELAESPALSTRPEVAQCAPAGCTVPAPSLACKSAASATGRALSRRCCALCLAWAANGIAHSERTGKSHEIGRPPPLLLQQQVGLPGAGCRDEGGLLCLCPGDQVPLPDPSARWTTTSAPGRPPKSAISAAAVPDRPPPPRVPLRLRLCCGIFWALHGHHFLGGLSLATGPGLAHSPIAGVLSRWRQAGTPAAKSCRRRPKNRISLNQLRQRRDYVVRC